MKGAKIFSFCWLCLSLIFFIGSFFMIPINEITVTSPAGYPIFISFLCLLFSFFAFLSAKKDTGVKETEKRVFDPLIVHMMILLILYVIGIMLIHYVPATLLFLFAALVYLKKGDWRNALMISYISTFMILLVFKYMFSVIMP